jgi:membrane dipeptidase
MTPVIDCHSDVMIDVYRRRQAGERAVLARVHLPAYAEGGVVASVCTVGGDAAVQCPYGLEEAHRSAVAMLDALRADVAEADGRVAVATSAGEARAAIDRGAFAVIPAVEGAMVFEGELRLVEDLVERGVRVVGLTWNTRNAFAVGLDSGEGGLTDLGREAVGLMNDLGVVIDLSHASPTTFWDVAEITRAPLFASHANARAVHDHPRNLDDAQLEAIAGSGGAAGLVFCPTFVAPQPVRLDHLLAHLAYFRERIGDDAIVIGADFCDYATEEMRADVLAHLGSLYDESTLDYPAGIETVRSMQNVVAAMPGLGFGADGIDKVGTANFLRVLRQTEARRAG